MAAQFVALGWPSTESAAAQAARAVEDLATTAGWRAAFQAEGIAVWTRGAALPVRLSAELDVLVIGRHTQPGGAACRGPAPGRDAAAARARLLLGSGWGAYVALLRDGAGAWAWAFRDPSGAVDAFTWRREGLYVAGSDIEGLPPSLLPARMGLDWDVLADLVRRPGAVTGRSALRGLTSIAPGELCGLGGDDVAAVWRPADWARRPAPGLAEARTRLRSAVDAAVAEAVSGEGSSLVEVSGGLDSAIVATAAAAAGRTGTLSALHLRGDRPEADEREWALQVTRALGWRTADIALSVTDVVAEDLLARARGARPVVNAPDIGRDRRTAAVAERLGARRLVTGKGGDAVFFQHPTPAILADHLAANGPPVLLGPLARNLARRLRRSVWSVAWEAVRASRPAPGTASRLLGARARAPASVPAHPWLADIDDLPPAKRAQISALVATQAMRGATRAARALEIVHPLLAQPVLEAALSIPVWQLAQGGRERGLAREVFADRLPEAIRTRRSKGDLDSFFARIVLHNLEFLRGWLLDGCLCGAGVLERTAVERALEPVALMQDTDVAFILRAAAIEAFARHWQRRVPDCPDAPRTGA